MPRQVRLEYPGACYHVINRGNFRHGIFAGAGAAEAFERSLDETCRRCGWRVHAYVIMRNHFHLAVETAEPNLSLGMKYLQGTWANRFNRYRGQVGRPFQGRYKALHVEPGHVLAQVAHYIHLNPARAKAVPVPRLGDFRWSSLWRFRNKGRPNWLESGTVLAEAGDLADTKAGWRAYLGYLALLATEDPREREKQFGRLSRGWAIGTKEFRQNLIRDLRGRGLSLDGVARRGDEPGDRQQFRQEIWAERLEAAAKATGLDLGKLGPRKSDPEKVILAAIMKTATDVSNGWLNSRLQMGTPASVSQFVRRFQQTGGAEDRRYLRALSRLET